MDARENWLRAVEFRYPEWIPCSVGFAPLVWKGYGRDLEQIVLSHPRIFPRYEGKEVKYLTEMPVVYRQGEYFRDNWGCLWYNTQDGLEGQVVEHPLANWSALATYRTPDLEHQAEREPRDWTTIRQDIEEDRRKGRLTWGNGERLFDRLYFLRGFENLMIDFGMDSPELPQLIQMLDDYEMRLIGKSLAIGVDVMSFHSDMGTQNGLMISPAKFRMYIKPMFKRIFQACRQARVHVNFSSDGRLLEIVDDLIECGVSVHDPQLRANTLEGIARAYKGKLCANVDLDRQGFPFMTPGDIREQIKQVVDIMAAPEGGLMVLGQVYGLDVPLRNIEAICQSMEDYCFP